MSEGLLPHPHLVEGGVGGCGVSGTRPRVAQAGGGTHRPPVTAGVWQRRANSPGSSEVGWQGRHRH